MAGLHTLRRIRRTCGWSVVPRVGGRGVRPGDPAMRHDFGPPAAQRAGVGPYDPISFFVVRDGRFGFLAHDDVPLRWCTLPYTCLRRALVFVRAGGFAQSASNRLNIEQRGFLAPFVGRPRCRSDSSNTYHSSGVTNRSFRFTIRTPSGRLFTFFRVEQWKWRVRPGFLHETEKAPGGETHPPYSSPSARLRMRWPRRPRGGAQRF